MNPQALLEQELQQMNSARSHRANRAISVLDSFESKLKFLKIANLFPDASIYWKREVSENVSESMAILETENCRIAVE